MSVGAVAWVLVTWIGPLDPLHQWNGIHDAARSGHALRVRIMLALRPDLVNAPQPIGKGYYPTPVHLAAERNHVEVLKLLIKHGGDVNDPGQAGGTPLQLAVRWGSTDTAEVLLKTGATLDIFSAVALNKRREVEHLFQLAAAFGLQKRLANIRSSGPYWGRIPLLNWAASAGHAEMVGFLLRQGAYANPRPSGGLALENSPLHEAAEDDRAEVIEVLLKHGARLETKDYDGFTPLHRAAAWGRIRAATVLLKHGAKIDNREDNHAPRISDRLIDVLSQNTILHTAVDRGQPEMVALLLAHRADPNACNAYGQTPLDMAVAQTNRYDPAIHGHKYVHWWKEQSDLCAKLLYRYGGKRNPPGTPDQRPQIEGLTFPRAVGQP